MHAPWAEWDHVLKVDPDKDLPAGATYEEVCGTGTDAIAVGGTLGVTREKSQRVVDACRRHDVPIYQEPSNPTVIVDDEAVEGYLVPIVLNAGDVFWVVGAHKEWARVDDVDWNRTTTEAYIVLNPEASAAELTEADCSLDAGDVAAYAEVAERLLGQRIVYVEYSGTFGDPETVAAAHEALDTAALFYGGGIRDYDAAYEMRSHADTVVVGDLLHDEGVEAVRETVEGAKDAAAAEQPAD